MSSGGTTNAGIGGSDYDTTNIPATDATEAVPGGTSASGSVARSGEASETDEAAVDRSPRTRAGKSAPPSD